MLDYHAQRHVIPREERRRTVLPAQMRYGGGWSDVCILSVSSCGLMVHSKSPAHPGSRIELKRGDQLIIARVIWRKNQHIGLWSDERVQIDDIISETTSAAAVPAITGGLLLDRCTRARDPDRSSHLSRAIEFFSVMLAGVVLAGVAGSTAFEAIAAPVAAVKQALATR